MTIEQMEAVLQQMKAAQKEYPKTKVSYDWEKKERRND